MGSNRKEDLTGKRLAAMAVAALGVVYGDIGTSPLYALKEVFAGNHAIPVSEANVFGSLSLLFWALIIVVAGKYVAFVMRVDNRGEGGIMALTALALHGALNRPRRARAVMIVGVLGAAMFYCNGMVTPAISVLSAVEGLGVATPALKPFVIPLTLLVLLVLFAVQRRGTVIVGNLFGPLMLLWFAVLAMLGLRNIVDHPAILNALDPLHGLRFLFSNGSMALVAMSGVMLAVTGAEVLYANMGPLGRKPISRAGFAFALPALVLNYFGQGALILADPEAARNPFFLSAPDWALYPLVALATLAALIASQAVISGVFSVTRQAMQLGYVPRMEVQAASDKEPGQTYLPAVNWGLMAVVMILVLGFQSSSNLTAAYGIAVTGDMVATSLLATVAVARIWRWGWGRAAALFGCFLVVELVFLAANILKIPDGGWFPLMAGAGVFILMTTWKQGRALLAVRLRGERLDLGLFLESLSASMPTRVSGTALFLNADSTGVPHALLHNLMHNKVLHERMVLVSVQFFDVPFIPDTNRVEMRHLRDNFWSVIVRYGFKDEPDVPQALLMCAESGLEFNALETSYFVGRETLTPRLDSEMALWREKLFVAMFRNAGSATAFFRIPSNRVVELGAQVVL